MKQPSLPNPFLPAIRRQARGCFGILGLIAALAAANSTLAAENASPGDISDPSIARSLSAPLATFGGLRPWLAGKGVTFQLNDIAETFANVSGGMRRGATLDNRLELVIDADLEKLAGWKGGSVHLNAFQINGTGPSRNLVGNILTISNIEALPSTRLYEAWIEQKLADGKLAIRAGQLAADGQFINSDYAGLFVNGTFGWPGLTAADLPSGARPTRLPLPACASPITRLRASLSLQRS
jgi:porin